MTKLVTRGEHMNKPSEIRSAEHHAYYMQFVTARTMTWAKSIVEQYNLVECDDQQHLNTPAIRFSNGGAGPWIWDFAPVNVALCIEAGECVSKPAPVTVTCIAKAAAREVIRQIKEGK